MDKKEITKNTNIKVEFNDYSYGTQVEKEETANEI